MNKVLTMGVGAGGAKDPQKNQQPAQKSVPVKQKK